MLLGCHQLMKYCIGFSLLMAMVAFVLVCETFCKTAAMTTSASIAAIGSIAIYNTTSGNTFMLGTDVRGQKCRPGPFSLCCGHS